MDSPAKADHAAKRRGAVMRHDVASLRTIGLDNGRAFALAKRGASPDSLRSLAESKIQKAFEKSTSSRSAMRRYHRLLTDYNRNNQKFLSSKEEISGHSLKEFEKRQFKRKEVSTLSARDFSASIWKYQLTDAPILVQPETVVPFGFVPKKSLSFAHAASKPVYVTPKGWVSLGDVPVIKFQIFVKFLGKTSTVSVSKFEFVDELVHNARRILRIEDVNFFFGNKKLVGGNISDYGISEFSTIHAVIPLVGGARTKKFVARNDAGKQPLSDSKGKNPVGELLPKKKDKTVKKRKANKTDVSKLSGSAGEKADLFDPKKLPALDVPSEKKELLPPPPPKPVYDDSQIHTRGFRLKMDNLAYGVLPDTEVFYELKKVRKFLELHCVTMMTVANLVWVCMLLFISPVLSPLVGYCLHSMFLYLLPLPLAGIFVGSWLFDCITNEWMFRYMLQIYIGYVSLSCFKIYTAYYAKYQDSNYFEIWFADGSVLKSEKDCDDTGDNLDHPFSLRSDFEVLNDHRVKAMLKEYFERTQGHVVWLGGVRRSPKFYQQLPFIMRICNPLAMAKVKFYEKHPSVIYNFRMALPTDDLSDGRAVCAGMSQIKHQDPRIAVFNFRYGVEDTYVTERKMISLAQVAQIMSLQCLQNPTTPIDELDRMIDLNYRNLHVVNLPMHLNMDYQVNHNTIEYIKYYVRYRREKNRKLGSPLNCLSPVLGLVGQEPTVMGIAKASLI
jgi:hypothetical protein